MNQSKHLVPFAAAALLANLATAQTTDQEHLRSNVLAQMAWKELGPVQSGGRIVDIAVNWNGMGPLPAPENCAPPSHPRTASCATQLALGSSSGVLTSGPLARLCTTMSTGLGPKSASIWSTTPWTLKSACAL